MGSIPDFDEPDPALDREYRDRAARVIPGGASTGSKRPDALYGPDLPDAPTHYVSADGCTLTTVGGRKLVDCTMALGSVALGYGDAGVVEAVVEAATRGSVSGLSPALEVEVAERLVEIVPCAESVRFLKSGAEGVAAAVRIARTYTGRDKVVGAGYFGWLDWWSAAAGVPNGVRSDFRAVPHDDLVALRSAVDAAGEGLAAIVIEPVVERLPSRDWIATARALCDRVGAVLVFDEVKTGFRLRPGGYGELSGVAPDLAVLGKAMANGHPLAAVVGNAEVMDAARATWISSTLASETLALAAASAVLDRHAQEDVCAALERIGTELRDAVSRALAASGATGVTLGGLPQMWFLRWDDASRQARFAEQTLERGVLFKRGAYNFAALAHDDEAILTAVELAASGALLAVREESDVSSHD